MRRAGYSRLRRGLAAAAALLAVAYVAAIVAFNVAAPDLKFEAIPENPFPTPLPPGFLWGASTAAHQIEGGNTLNDWARFESVAGNIRNGEKSGAAADHWNRVSEDIGLLRDLGANAYRLLPPLVAHRQLRVVRRLRTAIRPVSRRLRHAAAHRGPGGRGVPPACGDGGRDHGDDRDCDRDTRAEGQAMSETRTT